MIHSDVVGGSTAGRVMACPASWALSKDVPKTSTSFADEGSLLHNAIEAIVQGERTIDNIVGYVYDARDGKRYHVTPDHVTDALMPALAQFEEFCQEYGVNILDTEQVADWGTALPGAFGYIDVIAKTRKFNVILDWKFGAGVPVDAENNSQLKFYAVGAMLNPDLEDMFDPDLPTLMVICQPRVRGELSIAEVSTKDLLKFKADLKVAVELAKTEDPPIESGSHCRFCPAKPTCPLKIGKARSTPKPEVWVEALELAEEMEDWARSVFAAAEQELQAGATIPGWKLVAKRAVRQWIDEVVAIQHLCKLNLPLDQLTDTKLKSPAQVEKLLKGSKETIGHLVHAKSSGLTMVREADKRPAVPSFVTALTKVT